MRITTIMIVRNYQSSLYDNLGGLELARKQVDTRMRIQSAYEDPGAAANAAVLKSRYTRTEDYLNNLSSVDKWLNEQDSEIAREVSNIAKDIANKYSVEAITETMDDVGRDTYAELLRNLQNTMVQFMNSKFGDTFVLGGNAGTEQAPFELSADGTTLLYRGVNVNDPANQAELERLAAETSYVDIGYGLSFDAANTNIVPSTAMNAALPGISAIGYGQTNGTSNNMILLVGQMAEVLEADTFDRDAYETLWTRFQEGASTLRDTITQIGTKTDMIENTTSRNWRRRRSPSRSSSTMRSA